MSCANDAATCQLSRCLCLPDDGLPPHASRVVGGLNVYGMFANLLPVHGGVSGEGAGLSRLLRSRAGSSVHPVGCEPSISGGEPRRPLHATAGRLFGKSGPFRSLDVGHACRSTTGIVLAQVVPAQGAEVPVYGGP